MKKLLAQPIMPVSALIMSCFLLSSAQPATQPSQCVIMTAGPATITVTGAPMFKVEGNLSESNLCQTTTNAGKTVCFTQLAEPLPENNSSQKPSVLIQIPSSCSLYIFTTEVARISITDVKSPALYCNIKNGGCVKLLKTSFDTMTFIGAGYGTITLNQCSKKENTMKLHGAFDVTFDANLYDGTTSTSFSGGVICQGGGSFSICAGKRSRTNPLPISTQRLTESWERYLKGQHDDGLPDEFSSIETPEETSTPSTPVTEPQPHRNNVSIRQENKPEANYSKLRRNAEPKPEKRQAREAAAPIERKSGFNWKELLKEPAVIIGAISIVGVTVGILKRQYHQ